MRENKDRNEIPEMKRRERFRRPSSGQSPSVSTKRALLMLAICILCILVTRMLA